MKQNVKTTRDDHEDTVTGLYSRGKLADSFERLKSRGRPFCLLMLHLDNFKHINNTLGHHSGDAVLREVASRISGVFEKENLIRLGGAEFVIFAPEQHTKRIGQLVERVLRALAAPAKVGEYTARMDAQIGVAIFNEDVADAEELLKNSYLALHKAKELPRTKYAFYSPAMRTALDKKVFIERGLKEALDKQHFTVVYQPFINLKTGKLAGFEALLRWNHHQKGPISPGEFLPIAEQTGLIIPIGRWVMDSVLKQLAVWKERGKSVPVAVNFSARQLSDPELLKQLRSLLKKYQVAKLLEIEITESGILEDTAQNILLLKNLKRMNVSLALDDFGTGYSSLNYLKDFPVDKVKIDRSFVLTVTKNARDRAIVKSVIDLAHALGLKVCAEGVETKQQLDVLKKMGCDLVQGFYFSKALPAEELGKWLKGNNFK